ncbi:hypothetical protein [Desulforhopalus singaporensis]|nr:hypothetical protein [Desulforhopalus singaporensis]
MDNLANILALEIKQEIATRYFSFRKKAETESEEYKKQLDQAKISLQPTLDTIAGELATMKVLLVPDSVVYLDFLTFTRLPQSLGEQGDEGQSTEKKLNHLIFGPIFIKKHKHKKLVFSTYQALETALAKYCEEQNRLVKWHNSLEKEIDHFFRNNDIGSILDFLRQMNSPDGTRSTILDTSPGPGSDKLNRELRIFPPPPVSAELVILPLIPHFKNAKPTLKQLALRAFPGYQAN